jgi:hypothetical protein
MAIDSRVWANTRNIPQLAPVSLQFADSRSFDCPHCGCHQAVAPVVAQVNSGEVHFLQCLSCADLSIWARIADKRFSRGRLEPPGRFVPLYPAQKLKRRPKEFPHAPTEVVSAYHQACQLFGVHAGAAGAYTRRALELILDQLGYVAKSLLESIKLVNDEVDVDRKLPARIRLRLDYVKEIGNFALHVRRDGELAIVEIDEPEVSAALDLVEELIVHAYEEPAQHYLRAVDLNEKLAASGKKPIELPVLRPGVVLPAPPAAEEPPTDSQTKDAKSEGI